MQIEKEEMSSIDDILTLDSLINQAQDTEFEAIKSQAQAISETTAPQVIVLPLSASGDGLLRRCLDAGLIQLPDESRIVLTWVGVKSGQFLDMATRFEAARKGQIPAIQRAVFAEIRQKLIEQYNKNESTVHCDLKLSERLPGEEPLSTVDKKIISEEIKSLLLQGKFEITERSLGVIDIFLPIKPLMASSFTVQPPTPAETHSQPPESKSRQTIDDILRLAEADEKSAETADNLLKQLFRAARDIGKNENILEAERNRGHLRVELVTQLLTNRREFNEWAAEVSNKLRVGLSVLALSERKHSSNGYLDPPQLKVSHAGKTCLICYEDITPSSRGGSLHCYPSHCFHQTCLQEWVDQSGKRSCPVCNQQFF